MVPLRSLYLFNFYNSVKAVHTRTTLKIKKNCLIPEVPIQACRRARLAYVMTPRGCLHDTGATFAPRRVHSGSLSWLYICLHDTTTKSHAGASRPGVSSLRLSHRGENFTPVRNLATVSCKHETTTRVRCEIGLMFTILNHTCILSK